MHKLACAQTVILCLGFIVVLVLIVSILTFQIEILGAFLLFQSQKKEKKTSTIKWKKKLIFTSALSTSATPLSSD